MIKYDALLHNNKPTSSEIGLLSITVADMWDMVAEGTQYSDLESAQPNFDRIAVKCQEALSTDTQLWIHGEKWPRGDSRYVEVAEFVSKEYPAVKFGMPGYLYGDNANKFKTDFTTLTFYPHWPECKDWTDSARKRLDSELKQYRNVMIVLRPEFTKRAGAELNRKPLPACYWHHCIDLIENYPDKKISGIIYWGGNKMDWPEGGIEL